MADIRDFFDRLIAASDHISLLGQLRDKVKLALNAEIKRCGSCEHWMKSRDCPRERNINGRNHGPSCDDFPCSKFQETTTSAQRVIRLRNEAVDFAREHGLHPPKFREKSDD